MNSKLIGTIIIVATVFMYACNQTENSNTANVNGNANANGPVIATSTPVPNANANTRRGPTREEYERDKDRYSREAKDSGRKVGTGLNDG